jgi:glycine/D-amino acid oxidase-like deaminating enzyme
MTPTPQARCDLLIIGAGPAGMAAALAAAPSGMRIVVVDDNPAPGGQIWRDGPGVQLPPLARQYREGLARHANIEVLSGTRVVGLGDRPRRRCARTDSGKRHARLDAACGPHHPLHRRARTAAALPRLDAARRHRRGRPAGTHQGRGGGARPAHRHRGHRPACCWPPLPPRARPAPTCCAWPSTHPGSDLAMFAAQLVALACQGPPGNPRCCTRPARQHPCARGLGQHPGGSRAPAARQHDRRAGHAIASPAALAWCPTRIWGRCWAAPWESAAACKSMP